METARASEAEERRKRSGDSAHRALYKIPRVDPNLKTRDLSNYNNGAFPEKETNKIKMTVKEFSLKTLLLRALIVVCVLLNAGYAGDPEAKRLYDDLLSNYNRLIRPVKNDTEIVEVKLGLKLAQIVDVNLKNQIMTTNLWVNQLWYDFKLMWDPDEYGGVDSIYVPAEQIWLPDIVLFNNADGNYEVTLMTKATLHHDGKVVWNPPALYKSSCEIDVEFFPFDEQSCLLKFGSWTYHGNQVDLQHVDKVDGSNIVPIGIDLKEFLLSVEWDILHVIATRNEERVPKVQDPRVDLTFNITMRRKTLFYTVNLILPIVGITFLTILVFYLPSDSGEKVSLCISILLSLTVFFLLLAEIIPPSSLAVPLLGKYLLFTMVLVTMSIVVTVGVLNVHFRSPSTHVMSPWVRKVFIQILPKILMMKRPPYGENPEENQPENRPLRYDEGCHRNGGRDGFPDLKSRDPEFGGFYGAPSHSSYKVGSVHDDPASPRDDHELRQRKYSPDVERAIQDVQFIAQHMKDEDRDLNVMEDWKYVAMVLDRMFLWIFSTACIVGTCAIIFQAPSLYDDRPPLDEQLSEVGRGLGIPRRPGPQVLPTGDVDPTVQILLQD